MFVINDILIYTIENRILIKFTYFHKKSIASKTYFLITYVRDLLLLERQTTCVQIQRDQKKILRYQNICDMNSKPLGYTTDWNTGISNYWNILLYSPLILYWFLQKNQLKLKKFLRVWIHCSLLQPWRISNTSLLPRKLSEKLRSSSVRESCYRLTSSMYARIQWNSSCRVCGNVYTHCLMWKHMHIFIGLKFHCF